MKKSKLSLKKEFFDKISLLFNKAKSVKNPNDYVRKARRLAMKVNTPIPKEFKGKYCKHCYNYFNSNNYRVRTKNGMIIYFCLNCKKYSKFIIKKQPL